METKLCTCCKISKPTSDFSQRNVYSKNGTKKKLLSVCKSCMSQKRKERYLNFKEKNINYIYRFMDKNNQVLYIGKTQINLSIRINNHLSQGHIPKECYDNINKIQYIATRSKALMDIKEIYYINLYKPKYNNTYIRNEPAVIIKDFQNDTWIDYNEDEINLQKEDLVNDSYIFEPSQITSIFYRQRKENFLVYLEIKTIDNKKKQIRKGTFKTKEDAESLVEKLKSLYK